jgi:hypothetical protein
MLLELICGVHDPKLREEFLRQKDPTLINLVAIVANSVRCTKRYGHR